MLEKACALHTLFLSKKIMEIVHIASVKIFIQIKEEKNMIKVRDFKKMLAAVPEAAKELNFMIEGKADEQEMNLMDRNDYISAKFWYKEDLLSVLSEILGEVPSPIREKVRAAQESRSLIEMASKDSALAYLNECTDAEWDCIRFVIQDTIRKEFGIKEGTLVFYDEDGCRHTFSCEIECGTNRIAKLKDFHEEMDWMLRRYPTKVCFLDEDGENKTGLVILPDIKREDAVALQTGSPDEPLYWIDIDKYDE